MMHHFFPQNHIFRIPIIKLLHFPTLPYPFFPTHSASLIAAISLSRPHHVKLFHLI